MQRLAQVISPILHNIPAYLLITKSLRPHHSTSLANQSPSALLLSFPLDPPPPFARIYPLPTRILHSVRLGFFLTRSLYLIILLHLLLPPISFHKLLFSLPLGSYLPPNFNSPYSSSSTAGCRLSKPIYHLILRHRFLPSCSLEAVADHRLLYLTESPYHQSVPITRFPDQSPINPRHRVVDLLHPTISTYSIPFHHFLLGLYIHL